jgi:GT2 family glycosyltransferase
VSATVSAIVCTYDAGRWEALRRAVDSLQRQTREVAEILVVVDHNPLLLERVRQELPGVVAVTNDHEQGLSGARNSAVDAARGDLLAFLDDDATAARDWVERLAALCADERILGAGGRVVPRWIGPRPRWFPDEFLWVVGCTYRGVPLTSARVRNLYGGCFCIRREVVRRVGGFRTELGRVGSNRMGCEETELCIRAARESGGRSFWYEPAAVIVHDVPVERTSWTYFGSRCFAEGVSKARLARLVGPSSGLSTERTYVRRALPGGAARGLIGSLSGSDRWGVARATAITAGLAVTVAGYLWESLRSRCA